MTLCAFGRSCIFGEVLGESVILNEIGHIVYDEWLSTPGIRPGVELDEFVLMPNHLHGIILLPASVGAYCNTPQQDNPSKGHLLTSPSGTLGAIVRGFKSATTANINQLRDTPQSPVWQRNYYEHIVRDIDDLNRIRQYIRNNIIQWQCDEENKDNAKSQSSRAR